MKLLEPEFSVVKLSAESEVPAWVLRSDVYFLSKTSDELSIMCPRSGAPDNVQRSDGWRCLRVDVELGFEQIGVVATVSTPVANAGISLFLVSTYDRDYVLVHQENLTRALQAYEESGFSVELNG